MLDDMIGLIRPDLEAVLRNEVIDEVKVILMLIEEGLKLDPGLSTEGLRQKQLQDRDSTKCP